MMNITVFNRTTLFQTITLKSLSEKKFTERKGAIMRTNNYERNKFPDRNPNLTTTFYSFNSNSNSNLDIH